MENNTEIQNTEKQSIYENARNIMVLTTLSCLVLSFILPIILWFSAKDKYNETTKKYLLNLLNFELTIFLSIFVINILNVIPILGQIISTIASFFILLTNIIVILSATIKITKNENYKFPLTINLLQ